MVRISSTGDIIVDDTTKSGQQATNRPVSTDRKSPNNPPRIATQPNNVNQHPEHDSSPSFIDSMNRSLINWGVPRPTFNGIIIEPIYSVITILALLLFGLPGLLVIAFIYAARQFSRPDSAIGQMIGNFLGLRSNNNAPTGANNSSPTAPSRRTFGGAGNRLGDN